MAGQSGKSPRDLLLLLGSTPVLVLSVLLTFGLALADLVLDILSRPPDPVIQDGFRLALGATLAALSSKLVNGYGGSSHNAPSTPPDSAGGSKPGTPA